jgi:hypothetical protein
VHFHGGLGIFVRTKNKNFFITKTFKKKNIKNYEKILKVTEDFGTEPHPDPD